jgi:hypothetical protein
MRRLHISLKTQKAITKLGWTILPNPPRNPYSVTSDFHLFRVLKNSKCGKMFRRDDEVIEEVMK